jgi:hypothetical protein
MNDLKEATARSKGLRRAAVRLGRPPKELEGEVDARILDAARKIFLGRGFEGASMDEIAWPRAPESRRSMPASATTEPSSPPW